MVGPRRYNHTRNKPNSTIWLVLTSAYFTLHLLFLILLGKITAFGIDEDGYLEVFRKVYSGSFDIHNQISWPTNSATLLQLMYSPAKFISLFGVPDYLAIRFQSTILFYVTCGIIFSQIDIVIRRINITLLVGFMFLPSVFVWTSLGLRESFLFFWITLVWLSLRKLIKQGPGKYLFLLAISVNGLATTKIYLYILILLMGVLILILLVSSKSFKEVILIFLVFLSPLLILPGIQNEVISGARSAIFTETTSSSGVDGSGVDGSGVDGSGVDGSGVDGSGVDGSGVDGSGVDGSGVDGSGVTEFYDGQTPKLLLEQLDGNPLLKSLLSRTGILDRLNASALVKNTESEPVPVDNDFKNGSLSSVSELLLAVAKFLILPIPFTDNGSYFINLQSVESPFLYLAYIILICCALEIFKRKPKRPQMFLGLCTFAVLFTVQSALIEVNLGTLVRHRAILILIIVLASVETGSKLSESRSTQINIKP